MAENLSDSLASYVTPRNDEPLNSLLLELSEPTAEQSQPAVLPHNQEALLHNIGRFPCLTRKERQEKLGWKPQTMQNAIEALQDNFIQPVKTKKGGRGSSYVTYQLTEKAKRYMQQRKISFKKLHGGIQHHCAIEHWLEARRAEGFKTKAEVTLGNALIDGLATGDEETVGLEVVASDNISRDREKFGTLLGYLDRLEVVCVNADLEKQYKRQLQEHLPAAAVEKITVSRV